ncbi:hypothetical protein FB476_0996 [Ornithinimicrobium humiphilum]|uniref:Dolichyl-phosphate-mannose-protein mannosyltransferase n=1 Tax=Ornithinimicrobium humiphilum TaxID=125288 RepID=A0A543KM18_9MICO|nr:hypothetical protein [Ornithinimicrobium humiphilum]TQM96133.1 hypothetical protein FB476_0996 [Ornithinimicrobium humiphilum]
MGNLEAPLGWVTRALGLLLAAVALTALVAPRNTWFVLPPVVVWVSTAAVLLLVAVGRRPARAAAGLVARRPGTCVALGTVVGGALTALHLPLALVDFGWDARSVYWAAERWVQGTEQTAAGLEYFAKFPNNIPLLAYEGTVLRVGAGLGLSSTSALLAAQLGCVLVILWCLGSTLVRLGRPGAVWPVQALTTMLLGLNANLSMPYSDVPAAAAVAVALWAAVRAGTGAGRRWWAPALLALVVAVAFKAYAVALAVGALALVPGLVRRKGVLVATGTVLLAGAGLVAGVMTLHGVAARAVDLTAGTRATAEPAYPPLHFLGMGTYDSGDPSPTRTYGGWSEKYVRATGGELDPQAREAMLRRMVRDQIVERGVAGNVSFFARKVAWTWGDGTFWAFGEGTDKDAVGALGPEWSSAQRWFVGSGEPYQRWTAPVTQGVWVATLLLTAVGAWRSRDRAWVPVCALGLVTLTAYLTLFESRPRYLVALLPLLLLLTGLTTGRVVALRADSRQHASAQSGMRWESDPGRGTVVARTDDPGQGLQRSSTDVDRRDSPRGTYG